MNNILNKEDEKKAIITEILILSTLLILSGLYLRIFIISIDVFLEIDINMFSGIMIALLLNPIIGIFIYYLNYSRFKKFGFLFFLPIFIFLNKLENFFLLLSFLVILLITRTEKSTLKIYTKVFLLFIAFFILSTFVAERDYSQKMISKLTKDFFSSNEYTEILGAADLPFVSFVFNVISIFLYSFYLIILFLPSLITYLVLSHMSKKKQDTSKSLNIELIPFSQTSTLNNVQTTQSTQEQTNNAVSTQNNQNINHINQNSDSTNQKNPSEKEEQNNDPYAEIFKKYNLK